MNIGLYLTTFLDGEYRDDYVGRNMEGKACDAWEYNSEREAIIAMMNAIAMAYSTDDEDADHMLQIFRSYAIDVIGRGAILYFPLHAKDLPRQYRLASCHRSSTNMRYSDWVDEVHRGKVEDAAREMLDNEQYSVVQMEERSVSVAVAVDIREVAISE
jgi:hypothetical protein